MTHSPVLQILESLPLIFSPEKTRSHFWSLLMFPAYLGSKPPQVPTVNIKYTTPLVLQPPDLSDTCTTINHNHNITRKIPSKCWSRLKTNQGNAFTLKITQKTCKHWPAVGWKAQTPHTHSQSSQKAPQVPQLAVEKCSKWQTNPPTLCISNVT